MITAVIFDLDNCLAAADGIGHELLEPMFAAIRRANRGSLSDAALEGAFADCWRLPLDAVARKHGFSDEMLAAGWAVASQIEVQTPMTGYPDLAMLEDLPAKRFLVTSGFRGMQESKIDALGVRPLFDAVYVDAIDEPNRKGKPAIFREILERYHLDAANVLVVGDNPDSEIEAGRRLGMPTAQILRPGVGRGENAMHYIHELGELRELLQER
jgi:putative hydrolase of the HAD superfamily